MASPILDLVTTVARASIRIDGVSYELRSSNDLTLDALHQLEQIGPRIQRLLAERDGAKPMPPELLQLFETTCRLGVIAPSAVLDKLSEVQRLQVATVFMTLLPTSLLRPRAATPEASPAAGTMPSRASSGSTAARRRRGSVKPRSAS